MNSHGNADAEAAGGAAERDYTADSSDESRPYFRHDCTGCAFVGCLTTAAGRTDLYYCTRSAEPVVVARYSNEPRCWYSTPYCHTGTDDGQLTGTVRALARAAALAREQGLAAA